MFFAPYLHPQCSHSLQFFFNRTTEPSGILATVDLSAIVIHFPGIIHAIGNFPGLNTPLKLKVCRYRDTGTGLDLVGVLMVCPGLQFFSFCVDKNLKRKNKWCKVFIARKSGLKKQISVTSQYVLTDLLIHQFPKISESVVHCISTILCLLDSYKV